MKSTGRCSPASVHHGHHIGVEQQPVAELLPRGAHDCLALVQAMWSRRWAWASEGDWCAHQLLVGAPPPLEFIARPARRMTPNDSCPPRARTVL